MHSTVMTSSTDNGSLCHSVNQSLQDFSLKPKDLINAKYEMMLNFGLTLKS